MQCPYLPIVEPKFVLQFTTLYVNLTVESLLSWENTFAEAGAKKDMINIKVQSSDLVWEMNHAEHDDIILSSLQLSR